MPLQRRPRRTQTEMPISLGWPGKVRPLFTARSAVAFARAVFRLLQPLTACDFASVLYRAAGNALLEERDSLGRTYSASFMRRYAELTPAIPLAMAHPGRRVLPSRMALPRRQRELEQTAFYREVMAVQGWRHAVALCFWGQPQASFPVFVVTVNRSMGRTDFSQADIARMEALHPVLDAAVARLLQRSTLNGVLGGLNVAVRDLSHGLLVLDSRRRVVLANRAARRLCRAWEAAVGRTLSSRRGLRIPSALWVACGELSEDVGTMSATNKRRTRSPLAREVSTATEDGLIVARIAINPAISGEGLEPTFTVELHETSGGGAAPRQVSHDAGAILARLTAAERRVVAMLPEGLSNKEIADKLQKTVAAVKFLLHSAYRKSHVSNRTTLVALLRSPVGIVAERRQHERF